LLGKAVEENKLLDHPGTICNVEESGLQLNNKGKEKSYCNEEFKDST
jgi:hypothetical protein